MQVGRRQTGPLTCSGASGTDGFNQTVSKPCILLLNLITPEDSYLC